MKKYLIIVPASFLATAYIWQISEGLAVFVWGMVGLFWFIEYLAKNKS